MVRRHHPRGSFRSRCDCDFRDGATHAQRLTDGIGFADAYDYDAAVSVM
jgi:hypothetical protein